MYKATVKESSKELTAKQRIAIKDLADAIKLADDGQNGLAIYPEVFATISVHNDKSENQDYEVFVIIDKDGNKYYTSSTSFISAFEDIASDMAIDADGEEWGVKVIAKPSKNYAGRSFLTCTVI